MNTAKELVVDANQMLLPRFRRQSIAPILTGIAKDALDCNEAVTKEGIYNLALFAESLVKPGGGYNAKDVARLILASRKKFPNEPRALLTDTAGLEQEFLKTLTKMGNRRADFQVPAQLSSKEPQKLADNVGKGERASRPTRAS